ncbi:MAG: hypothetical protein R2726_08175 [Acidimicrobiales bacterium]
MTVQQADGSSVTVTLPPGVTLPAGTPSTIVAGAGTSGSLGTTVPCVEPIDTGAATASSVSSTADDVSAAVGLVLLGTGLVFLISIVAVLGVVVHLVRRRRPAVAVGGPVPGPPAPPG